MARYVIVKKPEYNYLRFIYKIHWWGNERIYYGSYEDCLRALENLKHHGTIDEVIHSESF